LDDPCAFDTYFITEAGRMSSSPDRLARRAERFPFGHPSSRAAEVLNPLITIYQIRNGSGVGGRRPAIRVATHGPRRAHPAVLTAYSPICAAVGASSLARAGWPILGS